MARFFYKAVILLLVMIIVSTGAITLLPHNSNHYMAATKDKYTLLQTTKSPRIILVGGSNVAFSIDSQKIEQRFNVPTINIGLHAGLGLEFMLKEMQESATSGDIIIVSPEYTIQLDGQTEMLANAHRYCAECISAIDAVDRATIAKRNLQLVENDIIWYLGIPRWGLDGNSIYNRKNFNQRGDFIGHLNQPNNAKIDGLLQAVEPQDLMAKALLLHSFYQACKERNAQVFLMFPGVPASFYAINQKEINNTYEAFQNNSKMPILGTPQDFIFDDSYFYDTVYHMNADGRSARTERIIEILSTRLEE